MNTQEIKTLIPQNFADDSKVWIYQSSRPFSEQQAIEIKEQLHQFQMQWHAHGDEVKGWAELLFKRFIIMMADEGDVAVSGCSIDSATRIIKSIERQYEAQLFDRLTITFLMNDKAEALPMGQVQYAIDKGFIDGNTLMFNNTVATKKELIDNWLQPLSQSWLRTHINLK